MLMAMKVNGNILLVEEGAFSKINPQCAESAIEDFAFMVKEADARKDKLFYGCEEWEQFYANSYDPTNSCWKGIGDIAFSLIVNISNPVLLPVGDGEDFDEKPEPKTNGGFQYDACPTDGSYVYNKETIEKWHDRWFIGHPERIDWTIHGNEIWPRFDRTVKIMRDELKRKGVGIPQTDKEIGTAFHESVMKPLNERERISLAKTIGEKVCKANYYQRESELEKLESAHGNSRAEMIFSIKKNGGYQFLSVDKQHGMLELCDDRGRHKGEWRFDGTPNGKDTEEADHGLRCVAEWKRKNNK